MPRDSSGTKSQLLDHAERLFAEAGIYTVTNREITEAAGQKNVSALNYHFGSRNELLAAVLARRGAELDATRGERSTELGAGSTARDLLHMLVVVYADCLHSESGRHYVRIVDQLRTGLVDWRTGASADDEHLQVVLRLLVERPQSVSAEIRQERLVAMMMLMTGMTAARAEHVVNAQPLPLDHATFVETLTDMLVAVMGV